jgi:hypothetical protein
MWGITCSRDRDDVRTGSGQPTLPTLFFSPYVMLNTLAPSGNSGSSVCSAMGSN